MARRGCLKFGCFGCLGVVALAAIVVGLGVTAVVVNEGASRPERRDLEQFVPSVRQLQPDDPSQFTGDAPSAVFPATEIDSPPGTVVLDLRGGEFRVEPGKPGDPIRIEADFDAHRFRLDHGYEEHDDGSWTYRVRYGPRGLFRMFGHVDRSEVRVILPPDAPLRLQGRIGMGESRVELGGLWVVDSDLEMGMGDHSVRFRRPLLAPMQRFLVRGSMGALRVDGLGNASPAEVNVAHRMGEMHLDLDGAWANDSSVTASCGMGECRVVLPDESVRVELDRATMLIGERNVSSLRRRDEPDPQAPTLRLAVSHSMGELNIR